MYLLKELESFFAVVSNLRQSESLQASLRHICQLTVETLERGGKILTFGNGGSATDALHLAEEFTGRFRSSRQSLPALCLSCDGAALTCIANDFGFEQIFARQVKALASPGDMAIGFSTSGNSANVVQGLCAARDAKAKAVGLLGCDGGRSLFVCDEAFVVPSFDTARIQEMHAFALHVICAAVEEKYGVP